MDEKYREQKFKLADGTEFTLTPLTLNGNTSWDVDCWVEDEDKPGDQRNHWNRWFSDYDKAKAEFERWRPK